MEGKQFYSKTPDATRRIAREIMSDLFRMSHASSASVAGFVGELGAGKTTVIQEIGNMLGVRETMRSPTFVFVKKYALRRRTLLWKTLFHIDAYRLSGREGGGIRTLGIKDIMADPHNIVFVEWAEKIKSALPKNAVWIEIRHRGGSHRHIVVRNF